ncbi:MAG: TSUP family transporter [Thermoplasmata archaeon]|nr:MAG: TSUP family transporter [Thermoplasmata archaeon]
MEPSILISIVALAFVCEYLDSSLGMGYGTILTPILIIFGYEPILVITSILFSQALASFSAAIFHQKYKNINLFKKEDDTRITFFIVGIGIPAIILAVLISFELSVTLLEIYISLVVIAMGIILLSKKLFIFSWRKLSIIGIFSVFNKALTGIGFGPVFTSGQIISGKKPRSSIGITTVTEAPICLCAFLAYFLLNRSVDSTLLILLSIGALLATPFGPYITTELKNMTGRIIVGILTVTLGLFIIVKILIWPYVTTLVTEPFFWAFISLFAFIGSSTTLCSKRLGKFVRFNIAMVAIFALGRFILVLPFCQQPRFEMGGWHYVVGGIIFVIGLIFLIPLFYINPFPAPDEKTKLVTTGFYGIIRNPIYLGEILWSLGWAIMLRSVIGVALVPFWWGGLLFHVILEEEDLERKLDQKYLKYKTRVRGRIFPGLPI